MKRPSPSMAVAVIAVIIALGASATATVGINSVGHREIKPNAVRASEIAQNAVGSSEIRGNAVRASEIGRNAVGASEIRQASVGLSDLSNAARLLVEAPGPAGPRGLTGPTGPAGPQGTTGPTGSAAAYALVNATTPPTVVAAQSKNIASANVTRVGTGSYCIGTLAVTPKNAVASTIAGNRNVGVNVGDTLAACAGQPLTGTITHVTINEVSASAGASDTNFNIWFED